MEDKITIIEGPPPVFEQVSDGWALGLNESPSLAEIRVTRLRTFNGPALIERCYRAWHKQSPIYLEYRSPEGLPELAPIMAARALDVPEGQVLILWVRKESDEIELELGFGDEDDEAGLDDEDNPPQE